MPTPNRYTIGPKLLGDIRETITRVDAIAPKTSGPHLEPRLQALPRAFRVSMGTTTATTWGIGETAAVSITGSGETTEVTNFTVPIGDWSIATASLNVIFCNVGGTNVAVDIGPKEYGRLASFTGTWAKGSTASVTLVQSNVGGAGGTFAASNYMATVSTTTAATAVLVRIGTSWTLSAFECDT